VFKLSALYHLSPQAAAAHAWIYHIILLLRHV